MLIAFDGVNLKGREASKVFEKNQMLIAFDGVNLKGREAVTEARLRQRGYIPFLEYFLNAKYPKIK